MTAQVQKIIDPTYQKKNEEVFKGKNNVRYLQGMEVYQDFQKKKMIFYCYESQ